MVFLHFGFHVTTASIKFDANQLVILLVRFLLLVDELINDFLEVVVNV